MNLTIFYLCAFFVRAFARVMKQASVIQDNKTSSDLSVGFSGITTHNSTLKYDFDDNLAFVSEHKITNSSIVNSKGLVINATINGAEESRGNVLQGEVCRIQIVVERMKHNLPTALFNELFTLTLGPPSPFEILLERHALAQAKIPAGNYAMRQLVETEVYASSIVSYFAASILKTWEISEIYLTSNKGTAEGFVNWFTSKVKQNDELSMFVACPDHYLSGQAFSD